MKTVVSDDIRRFFADSGVDVTAAGQTEVDVVIDHFDNWKNTSSGGAFGCFTGACCLMA
ncbi:hypothetical protein GCM10027598_17360 [Amycolatopsis oliviviridis]|uniref:Uncharacterized protein n=1 Tax=Amycolatopsis oliviviridis TaxID=1471590 RepID=A0ABQ3M6S1_9PSEU|nr:hypothetical protein [Amycolatopsis oliviviridis]GHH34349.1 hypothetical protein GCM10017790_74120 [Amycolatopsis oliviviridis]